MATNILYEGDGFLRNGPAYFPRPLAKAAEVKAAVVADDLAIEARERALRREYLPEWVCRLLEA
ncbi:MAG: hypothetical protein EXR28_10350 [Betaproteobacteria bacterium]|nr:hypothetical protein [Betaproteobacteria bacterium]